MGATADGDWCPNCGSPHCPSSCYYGSKHDDDDDSSSEPEVPNDSSCSKCDPAVCTAGCELRKPKETVKFTPEEEQRIAESMREYREAHPPENKRGIGDTLFFKVLYIIFLLLAFGFIGWICFFVK